MATNAAPYTVNGHRVDFERRRYGGGVTFTWGYVYWPAAAPTLRLSLGDPWQAIVPKRAEVEKSARRVLGVPIGAVVQSVETGWIGVVRSRFYCRRQECELYEVHGCDFYALTLGDAQTADGAADPSDVAYYVAEDLRVLPADAASPRDAKALVYA